MPVTRTARKIAPQAASVKIEVQIEVLDREIGRLNATVALPYGHIPFVLASARDCGPFSERRRVGCFSDVARRLPQKAAE
jgi:hypothetical protein